VSLRTLFFTPRGFLVVGGIVLLVLGILGFLNIFTSQSFYLTTAENIAHATLGVIALAAVYVPGLRTALAPNYRWLVIAVGLISLFFGVYSLLLPAGNPPTDMNTFGVANLEFLDSVIHLVIAAWAFAAAFWTEESTPATH
jgi:hypothetical protein